MSSSEEKTEKGSEIEVHSANSWETVDLGDKRRNEKFLRLMGAKKDHQGHDHGPVHPRQRTTDGPTDQELAERYRCGIERRLIGGRKGHLGLGFHGDVNMTSTKEKDNESDKTSAEKKEDVDKAIEKDDDGGKKDSHVEDGDACKNDRVAEKFEDGYREKDVEKEDDTIETHERKRENLDHSSHTEGKRMKYAKSSS